MIDFDKLHEKLYRMNHLYHIINKDGVSVLFQMNEVQVDVFKNMHNRSLILKARQLGMSTLAVIWILDEVLFNENLTAGIVSYSVQHASHIIKKIIGHALKMFPVELRPVGITQQSARSLTFSNGSFLQVDTTLRGGTCQMVLVTEFGKTCCRYPLKSTEIVTGTLESVPADGVIIIESTGEGNEGHFADAVNQAVLNGNETLNNLDYKLFFYPWYSEQGYRLKKKGDNLDDIPLVLNDYFNLIEKDNKVVLEADQRLWYYRKSLSLGDKMKQEYPSSIAEAFLSSSDAYYFAEALNEAYNEGRMVNISVYDASFPVYVAMDIGVNDLTVIVFFQVVYGEINIIDYYEDNNKGVDFYCHFLLQDKPYNYHTIFLPHDSVKRDGIVVENSYDKEFRKLFSHTNTKFVVLRQTDKNINISNAKLKLARTVFSVNKVKTFIDHLTKYRKQWNEGLGRFIDKPLHNISSNHADAFIYTMQGVTHIETRLNVGGDMQKHRDAVAMRNSRL